MIRASDGIVVRRITVPGAVHDVALNPGGNFGIATHPRQDSVSVVDLVDFSLVKTLKTGSTPNYAAVSNDGKWAYVSNSGDNTISEIGIETWTVNQNKRASNSPQHLELAADRATFFVANIGDGTGSAIPLKDDTETQTFEVGGILHGIDLPDDQKTVFASGTEKNKLYAIDLGTGQIRSAAVGPSPYHLTTIPGTGPLYLTSVNRPAIWVVDQKSQRVWREIDINGKGHQIGGARPLGLGTGRRSPRKNKEQRYEK